MSKPINETRQRIVTATNELFRARGYNGTSLKQVTVEANAPTGSLYHFFPGGKDELGATVIRESGAAYQQLFEMIADEATDIAAAVAEVFTGASNVLEETGFIDPCPIGTIAREVANTNEALRLATAEVFANWNEAVTDRLEAAGLDRDRAAALAGTVVSALEGGFILARANRDTTQLRETGRHMATLVAAQLAAD